MQPVLVPDGDILSNNLARPKQSWRWMEQGVAQFEPTPEPDETRD